jgi:CubicO group peptidase (beta-lactamase class C family)
MAAVVAIVVRASSPTIAAQPAKTRLEVKRTSFMLNDRPMFLLGASYYSGLAASEETIRQDLDDLQRRGFNWIRVWATWGAFDNEVSAVDAEGRPREPYLGKLQRLVAECDRRGMVVDVTLSRSNGITGPPRLQTLAAHRRGVETVVAALKSWPNWYLDLSNERNLQSKVYASYADLRELRTAVRRLDPQRLVTASHSGDLSREELREYLRTVEVDLLAPHRPRHAGSPRESEKKTRELLGWMKEIGREVPVHYQEPFRRGFSSQWEPSTEDFAVDLRGALAGGAAGWCFHNGDQRDRPDGRPRRSFDLRTRLFEQCDEVERAFLDRRLVAVLPQLPNGQKPPAGPTPAEPSEAGKTPYRSQTRVAIVDGRWRLNGKVTYPGARAEGLLMNVRMVNAVFEDAKRKDFDPEANTTRFLAAIPDYVSHGVRAFTIGLQGGFPGYEGAINSAFAADGSLRAAYLDRVARVIEACDRQGAAVILGCYYQRQDQILRDEAAVRAGVVQVARWLRSRGYTNVLLEIANEYPHEGFDHRVLRSAEGEASLLELARRTAPGLLVSTSGIGDGELADAVARASDFLLIHFNGVPVEKIPGRIAALKKYGKPIVCNEDDKASQASAEAARASVAAGASWGLMLEKGNQHFPFSFRGAADDPLVYDTLRQLTAPPANAKSGDYFPPPESQGGWRKLEAAEEIRRVAGMDPAKLADLKEWLLRSDNRDFAAVVIRRGYLVLEVERGNSAKTDSRRVASVSKAVCATVLAIASERSRQGPTPRKMTFDDPAFDFIPWASPLSDPRKAQITVRQLLNHTSGLCPEATGAPNEGTWQYVLGLSGDPRTAKLAFDPGTACGYSTHALDHAALVCETVTGKPYDQFAIESLFRPLGVERWWFEAFDGGEKIGRHPTHGLGMPARDLARIAYCMLRGGRWGDRQVVPKWFVDETASPTHRLQGREMRFKVNAQTFSHGWELPARLTGEGGRSGEGIPADARHKPGSGGQLIAFVPSLDLVITRQTGSSGDWQFEEYLRRACQAIVPDR